MQIYSGVEQLVARKAHNLEVAGSSPVPAPKCETVSRLLAVFFISLCIHILHSTCKELMGIAQCPVFHS